MLCFKSLKTVCRRLSESFFISLESPSQKFPYLISRKLKPKNIQLKDPNNT